ncbi:CBL-interacting protein kinase 28 [Biomphalaria glabrata]|nr:CBL-interacting protein kinase 28-like [Biomphalaria glabrata]KAI8743715.1 CBL-interacting protein kinase 28 [Biomphalaria glabrata]
MDALISGDNSKAHTSQESCCSSAKTPCMVQGSASGDSQGNMCHEFVTVLRDIENEGSQAVIHTHACDLDDVWSHKYPLPLSKYPPKTIKTGNKYYDVIIPDLPQIGYKPLQVIAKGRSGTVLLAQDLHPGIDMREAECQPVAIKLQSGKKRKQTTPTGEDSQRKEAVSDEILIHQRLHHEHIVALINTICYQGRTGLVMEFCESGNLETLLRAHDARFVSESNARKYLRQLHSALEYMHLSGVAHRDICPQNILITNDNTVKIGDFSHAVNFSPGDHLCTDIVGTVGYQAPEMLLKQQYHPRQTDMWSLGAVLFTMVIGRLPYGRIKTEDEARSLKPLVFPPPSVLILSSQVKELLIGMLAYVPSSRYTLNRVKNSEWFNMASDRVQIGSFYLVRQPQKVCDGEREREVKAEYEI